MLVSWLRIAAAAFCAVWAGLSAPASHAEDAAQFYKGKVIRFVVGFGPGGGFDAYARMIAPHLAKLLDATVIVENQPGAGGIIALNRIASAPADGLLLMIVDGTPAALGQLLGQENVRYDLARLDHLGMISGTRFIWLVHPQSKLKLPEDVGRSDTKVLWGSAGPTDGPTGSAAFTCEALHIACKVILGYPGSSEMMLALSRSEVDANYLSESSAYNLVEGGQARALTALSRTRSPLLPQVPTIFELFRFDADAQWLLDFRANLNDLGRILVTQAGTQPERLALLQSAIRQVLTDPEIVAEGRRTGRIVEFQEAAVARAKAVSVLQAISPEQKERVRAIALEKYLR